VFARRKEIVEPHLLKEREQLKEVKRGLRRVVVAEREAVEN